MARKIQWVVVMSILVALGGCFEDDDRRAQLEGQDREEPPTVRNSAPTITGAPPRNVLAGETYEFTPAASDPDGDALEYSVSRKPAWASFDRTTGRLWGTPQAEDVGNFTNIGISVSDGEDSASLTDFDVSVDPIAAGSATLSWMPPTQNDDGTPLTDLAGYKIYYGRDQTIMGKTIVIDNPGLTRFVIENLVPSNWYFTMTAVNSRGVESNRSGIISKVIG